LVQVCAKAAAEDSRRAALAQCMWRQTANCNPDGAREAAYDKDCLTQIPNGVSGMYGRMGAVGWLVATLGFNVSG
jgi:hypothetical protein